MTEEKSHEVVTVTIPAEEYEVLLIASELLYCLNNVGVGDRGGYADAQELLHLEDGEGE